MIHMDNIFVLRRSLCQKETSNFPVNVQSAIVAGPVKIEGFVAGSKRAVQQFAIGYYII
jgi:hypothetical protein